MGSFLCPPSPGWLLALTSPRFPQTERCYIRSNSHLSSTYFHNIHGFVHILFLNQRDLTAVLPGKCGKLCGIPVENSLGGAPCSVLSTVSAPRLEQVERDVGRVCEEKRICFFTFLRRNAQPFGKAPSLISGHTSPHDLCPVQGKVPYRFHR